ncbi:membrane protein YfhO [Butyrivibrio sp. Su6]|uniref:YfhO family protein n=1 Tax=Butyrivibrio sp. Su6 TaxID=1520810 RepID=UPI00089E3E58|nr:YfhO family protein [Butyrivibrio sp. Su6]SEG15632.1 membrane protein YfhO [Butyrivibrio sp. Su6]
MAKKAFKVKNNLYICSFAIPIICLLLTGVVCGVGVGDKSVLTWDASGQYINFFLYLHSILNGNSNEVFWSLSITPGANNILLMAYYLLSPLNLIVVFFDKYSLPYAFMIIQLVKIGLAGLFMYIYQIHTYDVESNKEKRVFFLITSTCYALCGFSVVYMSDIMWLDAFFAFPLLADGIRKIVNNRGANQYFWLLLYSILSNFYIGYMVAIFSFLLFIFFFIRKACEGDTHIKKVEYYRIAKDYICYSVLSVGASMVLLLPLVYQMSRSAHGGAYDRYHQLTIECLILLIIPCIFLALFYIDKTIDKKIKTAWNGIVKIVSVTAIIPLVWKIIQKLAYMGWLDKRLLSWPLQLFIGVSDYEKIFTYEVANLYMGILPAVLLIFYAMDKRVDKKRKYIDLTFLIVLLCILTFYDLNLAIHGLKFPGGSPHRWVFVITFFVISIISEYYVDYGFMHLKKELNFTTLVVWCAVFLVAIKIYHEYTMNFLHKNYIIISFIFVALYLLILHFREVKKWIISSAVVVLIIEISLNMYGMLRCYSYLPYSEYKNAIAELEEIAAIIDDPDWFRTEINIPLDKYNYAVPFNTVTHYSSANTEDNMVFMAKMGFAEENDTYFLNCNLLAKSEIDSFLGIRYIITDDKLNKKGYSLLYKASDKEFYIYKNDRSIPMVFPANSDIGESDYLMGVDENVIEDLVSDHVNDKNIISKKPFSHYNSSVNSDEKNNSLYFLIPYDKGWRVFVDGEKVSIEKAFGYYMKTESIEPGVHDVEFRYVPPYLVEGAVLSCAFLIIFLILNRYNRRRCQ